MAEKEYTERTDAYQNCRSSVHEITPTLSAAGGYGGGDEAWAALHGQGNDVEKEDPGFVHKRGGRGKQGWGIRAAWPQFCHNFPAHSFRFHTRQLAECNLEISEIELEQCSLAGCGQQLDRANGGYMNGGPRRRSHLLGKGAI